MTAPDVDVARSFLAAHPPPGDVVVVAVTGSHLYGFPSPDSDLDLKGIHQAPTRRVLSLDEVPDAFDRLLVHQGVECDLTTNELGQALRLLLAGNGNLLERILSPWVVASSPAHEELKALAQGSLSQRSAKHYRGYLIGMIREHGRQSPPQAKSLLYCWRVALTGRHLLEAGEVEAHLPTLAERYGHPEVLELVDWKRGHNEVGAPPEALLERLRQFDRLRAALDDALDRTALPAQPANRAAINDWLVQRRLACNQSF